MRNIKKLFGKNLIEASEDFKKIVIRGNPVSPYKAEGIARVINNEKELPKTKENEVLILIDSTPLMVPYLVKAKGFVGERGGFLCHLAIVSREFEKACVNGIPNATKVIENGDYVKINGLNGIVEVTKK